MDLSTREVATRYKIKQAIGSYDLAFSPVNSHIFARARLCCVCGFEGKYVVTCGERYSSIAEKVLDQTGQFADANPQKLIFSLAVASLRDVGRPGFFCWL